jgi:hypothetical protein
MSLAPVILALAAAAATPAAAHGASLAGETACWFEGGVVVVPAEVAGVAGDFILDTAAPQTLLAETQAQGAGYEETALTADVALAGRRRAGVAVAVQALDVRTGLFPTPIAGVIGADVLNAYVVDLSFAPCRLRLSAPGEAPPFGHAISLPLTTIAGLPSVPARVSDGSATLSGAFLVSTGADAPLRLSDAAAAVPGAARPQELYPDGVLRPRLRALSFSGRLYEGLLAGLFKPPEPRIAGEIGAAVLHDLRVRIDMPGGRMLVAPNEKGPGSKPRP